MALSRKFLTGMGLSEEQITAIIEANDETVRSLKDEIEKNQNAAKESGNKIKELEKSIEDLKNTAAANEGKNPWRVKYDALKEEFEGYKAEEEKKATKSAKEKAYRELLKTSGVAEKRIASVMKVSDIDSIELDGDGKIKDSDKWAKNIQEEWSDFITSTGTKGADTPTPPDNKGGSDTGSSEAIDRIIAQRAELYGKQE